MSIQLLPSEPSTFTEAKTPQLAVASWSSLQVVLAIRGFTKDGIFDLRHTTGSARGLSTTIDDIPGIPLSFYVGVESGANKRGQCYVAVILQMGGVRVATLAQGYVYTGRNLSYPAGKLEDMHDGIGYIRSIEGTNPAANTNISEAVPTNAIWELLAVHMQFVADANAANRTIVLKITDGTNLLFAHGCDIAITAGQTRNLTWARNTAPAQSAFRATYWVGTLGDFILGGGYKIETAVENFQAGDNFGAPQLWIIERLEE